MKIRAGFVSNSSSSSFVAFGVPKEDIKIEMSDEEYIKKFDAEYEFNKKHPNVISKSEVTQLLKAVSNNKLKISYAKEFLGEDSNDFDSYQKGEFCVGGQEDDYVAIDMETLLKNHPDLPLGQIKSYVADQINKEFCMNISEKDIQYIEEGWYDG
jgi:hypothetical protein